MYVDTSVFGGAEDPEFAEHSRRFLDLVDEGLYVVLVSAESMREIARAPDAVRARFRTLSADDAEEIPDDPEIAALAERYVRAGVVGSASTSDLYT